jgi:ABC-2 type transport system permease protein
MSVLPAFSPASFSPQRVGAMVRRYSYLLRSSWSRILDLVYWPAVQMITWGFLQTYLAHLPQTQTLASRATLAAGTLIGAIMLWDILFRGQLGFSVSFLEEIWSRNIGNLMMSPLRPSELIASLMVMSLIRLGLGLIPVTLLAIWFFGFNLWSLGIGLALFFVNLILTSWSIGLITAGLVLRNGLGAENLMWTVMFLILPLACVYYPVAVLPPWLQVIAWCLPPTYVFEGMRALLLEQHLRLDLMAEAFCLNVVLFSISIAVFYALLQSARRIGSLLQTGE